MMAIVARAHGGVKAGKRTGMTNPSAGPLCYTPL